MSSKGSYVDLFKTDLIDERIKHSFNQTTSMLTNTFSRSMPDLTHIPSAGFRSYATDDLITPRGNNNRPISRHEVTHDRSLSRNEVDEERPLSRSKVDEERPLSRSRIGEENSGIPSSGDALKSILSVENVSAHEYQHDSPYKYYANHMKDLMKEKRIMNLNHITEDSNVNKPFRSLSSGQLYNDGLSPGWLYDNGLQNDFLHKYHPDNIELNRSTHKRLSIADEYKKFQHEINMQNEYNHVYSRYEHGRPWYNRTNAHDRDSLESFRLNSQVNSLDQYTSPKHIDNDLPLSEPTRSTQPYESRFSINRYNPYLESRGMKKLYEDRLLDYSGYSSNNPGFQQSTFNNQTAEEAPQVLNTEVETDEIDENLDENDNTEVENNESKSSEKTKNGHGQDSYADMAAKRKETHKRNNKRLKRRVTKESKDLVTASSKKEDILHCRCSDEEQADEIDAKESFDYVRVKPTSFLDGKYYQSENPYLQRPPYMATLPSSNPYKVTPTAPAIDGHKADKPSNNVYDDSPLARKYFADARKSPSMTHQNALPPLNLGSPKSPKGVNGYTSDHSNHSSGSGKATKNSNQVDPLAFKLVNTDAEVYMAKRNKMIRQKEYAELLRQHQQEIPKEKPQVRSWNMKTADEQTDQEFRRAAAFNYAQEIQKPVSSSAKQDEHVDAIEVMKQRHEEEKRAIEQMRLQIQMKMAQATF